MFALSRLPIEINRPEFIDTMAPSHAVVDTQLPTLTFSDIFLSSFFLRFQRSGITGGISIYDFFFCGYIFNMNLK